MAMRVTEIETKKNGNEDCKDKDKDSMKVDLGKILMSGSVRNSSSWLLQLAAAKPKSEKAPPKKTSVILI